MKDFLPVRNNYKNLIVYQKAECIYDITFYFAHKYLKTGDRTIDQMIQAARSGKQNIAEGSSDGTTSIKMELKLLSVAKSSFHELLCDYEDYLRTRGLNIWQFKSEKAIKTRKFCAKCNDSSIYRKAIELRNDETIANICLTLLYQEDYLLKKLFDKLKEKFLTEGGISEQMTKARLEYRNNQGNKKQ